VARAILDERIVDIELSPLFFDLVLDRPVNISSIMEIDRDLGKVLI
jgi:hypothetical protein